MIFWPPASQKPKKLILCGFGEVMPVHTKTLKKNKAHKNTKLAGLGQTSLAGVLTCLVLFGFGKAGGQKINDTVCSVFCVRIWSPASPEDTTT